MSHVLLTKQDGIVSVQKLEGQHCLPDDCFTARVK